MTRMEAAAAMKSIGPISEIRRWRDQPPILAALNNAFQVMFTAQDTVQAVEVSAPELEAMLGEIQLLTLAVDEVLALVSRVLEEQPVASERDTAFDYSAGLALWRPTREDPTFRTALIM